MPRLPDGFGEPKARIEQFEARIQGLVAMTLADNHESEVGGVMIEALTSSLAFTIAMVSKGDPQTIDDMCTAASSYLLERCSGHRMAGEMMARLMGTKG